MNRFIAGFLILLLATAWIQDAARRRAGSGRRGSVVSQLEIDQKSMAGKNGKECIRKQKAKAYK